MADKVTPGDMGEPPISFVWLGGSLAIVAVALLLCALLGWEFSPRRAVATAGVAACFCLRAWLRRASEQNDELGLS